MPERWENEIKKLREFEPGADLGSRVAEGPRGEPSPPARQRVVAAVTALVLFAAAAIFAVRVFGTDSDGRVATPGPGPDDRIVIELSSGRGGSDAPVATMRYADREQHGVAEGYTWCDPDGQCSSSIADFAFYPPVSEYLVVPPGTPIEFIGDGVVEQLRLYVDALDTNPIEVDGDRIPDENAIYALGVNATWALASGEHGESFFFFGVQALSSPSAAPDVLRVDCSAVVARTNTAVVRTQADGLHVVFEGTDGFVEYGVVTPEGTPSEDTFGVGGPFPVDGQGGVPVDPGAWEVGCGSRDRPVEAGDLTAAFEIVDPDDHWAPFELGCDEPAEVAFSSSISSSVPHEDAAAQLVAGLEGQDRLRGAGYGAGGYKLGIAYVVDRGGVSVARLVLTGGIETWRGTFSACPDSGIVPTEAAAPTSPAPKFPDVLVVRCEGLGPAVDADTVQLQADGLHIEATNVADAAVIAIDPEDGTVEAIVRPFETATEEFVVDVSPGPISIGCRVLNEQGELEGGPAEVPGAYLQVTVVPTDG
ncbi:MAG: hypothetical protein ACRDHC_10960 [Actinomycetota bacterium]